jgi:hypothetical protein
MRDVIAAGRVMRQSLFDAQDSTVPHGVSPRLTLVGAAVLTALLIAISALVIALLALTR